VLTKMYAAPKPEDIPVVNPKTIDEADGFAFGFPTRFGSMPAQMQVGPHGAGVLVRKVQVWQMDAGNTQ
jgi:NAD(P)H dehydrogenase (quinone)